MVNIVWNIDGVRLRNASETNVPSSASTAVQNFSQQEIVNESEVKGAIKELNNDDIDASTRMSGIDMRSILHYLDIGNLARVDTLVAMKFLPISCLHLTRQIKRLRVSHKGQGREQVVTLVAGKRENDMKAASMGIMGKMGFGGAK